MAEDKNLLMLTLAIGLFFILMLIPIRQGSEDLGMVSYKNATLVGATFEQAHYERSGLSHHYVPDAWRTVVRVGNQKITSDRRAIYNSVVSQNSTVVVVKVSKTKVFYKIALFQAYEDYEYSMVE